MLLRFVLLLAIWVLSSSSTSSLSEYERLTAEASRDSILRRALDLQGSIFEEISTFEREFGNVKPEAEDLEDKYDEFGNFMSENDGDYGHLQTAQVHTDVVFVGFPSSAVQYIEREWLDSVIHESNSEGSYGGRLFDMPGDLSVRHHYHLLQVSFHVADLIRDTILNMMKGSLAADKTHGFIINAWEIELMLDGLTKELRSTGPAFESQGNSHKYVASNTIYVLNLDLKDSLDQLSSTLGAPAKYAYQNGFTEAQLDRLATDSRVVQMSKTVLKEQSNAYREVITERDLHSPSLTDNRATEIVQSIMSSWYWPKEDNLDDYGWGYDGHYRRSKEQIHGRQAVKESREWAQGYGDTTDLTLEMRALGLLGASPEKRPGSRGADYRYSLARAVLRHAKEAVEGKRYGHRDPACGAGTWVSGSNFAWIDQGASVFEPHAASLYTSSERPGGDLRELQPRALRTTEWATLGDIKSNLKRDVDKGLTRIGEWILDHYSSVLSLAAQTRDCPEVVIMDLPRPGELDASVDGKNRGGEGTGNGEYGHGWEAEGMDYRGLEQAHASSVAGQACTSLLKQAVFLRNCYFHFKLMQRELSDAQQKSEVTGLEDELEAMDRHEARIFLRRLKEIHFDSMRDVAATVGADLAEPREKGDTGVISESASAYLGHTLARVLELSDQLASPPLGLHLNPHKADLPLPGDTELVAQDGHTLGGAGNRDGKRHSALGREQELGMHQMGLADYVGSRVKGHAQAQQGAADGVDDYSLVTRALPPLSFPQRIDVVVYVVRLQSKYNPISADSASADTAFDYRQLVRSLSDMALPNQELTVSLHSLDVYSRAGPGAVFSEKGHEALLLAMRSCERIESSSSAAAAGEGNTYLDADCVWAHLRSYDATNAKGAAAAAWRDRRPGTRSWADALQHVPVFVLSVDRAQPLFANSALDAATAVADGVLAVQNAQSEISTGQLCGGREIHRHGRDPTGDIVRAAGRVIAGISAEHHSTHAAHLYSPDSSLLSTTPDTATTTTKRPDVLCAFGRSVSFQTAAEAELGSSAFSAAEVNAAHRARMLRAIGHCHVLLRASVLAAPPGTVTRRQATIVRTYFVILLGRLLHEVEIAEPEDLQHVASQCNAVYFLVESWLHDKELPDEVYYSIDDTMGGLPLDDREGASDRWTPFGSSSSTSGSSGSSGGGPEGFSLLDLVGVWPTVLFLASFAASFFWPKKKRPDRYL